MVIATKGFIELDGGRDEGGAAGGAGIPVPIESSSLERVHRGILRALYEGRFVPGQRLVEPDLMRQFGVGRGAIREVFNRLHSAGIITLVRHRGAVIHMLSRNEMNELLDVAAVLFGLAARRATALVASDPAKAQLLVAADEKIKSYGGKDDLLGFADARETYYRTVINIGGNQEISKIFPAMKVHIMRLQLRNFEGAADAFQISDYGAVTEAILSGDEDQAEIAARTHVHHTTERIALAPDRAFGEDLHP